VLKATVEPANASNKTVVWSSSDATIATVNATGTVTAKSINGTVFIYATNTASGKVGVCKVIVGTGKSTPAIADEPNLDDVYVYPNPTSGVIQVTSYELQVTGIEIFDVMGRNVGTLRATSLQNGTIDIAHLPTGVYFLRIQTEAGTITRRVIKN